MSSTSHASNREREKEKLMNNLLDAVSQCKFLFPDRTHVATEEGDTAVSILILRLEQVLQHGLKIQPSQTAILDVARKQLHDLLTLTSATLTSTVGVTTGGDEGGMLQSTFLPVFWDFIKLLLTKHEYERFTTGLKHVKTNVGRGRAWLRASLNENTLERYLATAIEDKPLISQFFDEEALIADQHKALLLPSLAADLSTIFFALRVDCPQFDTSSGRFGNQQSGISDQGVFYDDTNCDPKLLEPVDSTKGFDSQAFSLAPITHSTKPSSRDKKRYLKDRDKRRKRQITAAIIKEGPDNSKPQHLPAHHANSSSKEWIPPPAPPHQLSQPPQTPDILMSALQQGDTSYCSSQSTSSHKKGSESSSVTTATNNTSDNGSYQASDCDSSDESHAKETLEEASLGDTLKATSTDVTPVNTAPSFLLGTRLPVSDREPESTLEATFNKHLLLKSSAAEIKTESSMGSLSMDELRKAAVHMMQRKDVFERENNIMRDTVRDQSHQINLLSTQLSDLKTQYETDKQDWNNTELTLKKESDVLRNQLKKYISAVQMLSKDKQGEIAPSSITSATLSLIGHSSSNQGANRTLSDEVEEIYEDKLAQVAQMHAELMEFNDTLHVQIAHKDRVIAQLQEELVQLRGPLPGSSSLLTMKGIESESTHLPPAHSTYSEDSNAIFVNLWIPTAFLRGSGSESHHIYQVYVKVGTEEWNVYKRYKQFHDLHQLLRKKYPIVDTFEFPRKKTVRNKDNRLVEERRMGLQSYLRCTVNFLLTQHIRLRTHLSKDTLTNFLPFLSSSSDFDWSLN